MVNIREIKDLINLMNENDLSEIEVEFEGGKVKLRKGADGVIQREAPLMHYAPATPQVIAPPAAVETPKPGLSIKSPMVGTFYASPAPDSDAYVQEGSKVEVGEVVCIVEAMKLMNEIKSEIKGTVTKIHIKNGEPVEFGQELFSVTA